MTFKPETRSLLVPTLYGVSFTVALSYGFDMLAWVMLLMCIVAILHIWRQQEYMGKTTMYQARTVFLHELKGTSETDKLLMGLTLPGVDVSFANTGRNEFYHGTNVPMDWFRQYIRDSDDLHVSALRNYKSRQDIDYWHSVTNRLRDQGYVVKDAAGNHSHSWVGKWHSRLWQFAFPVNLVNMGEVE